jgi:hypothetical protein
MLKDPEVRALARRVTRASACQPFGAYIFHADEPGAELARHVEQSVFLETFGNTPDLLAREYGQYEASSLFICVLDHLREVPAGVMRVIRPSGAGFKSLNDIEPVWGEPAAVLIERTGLALDRSRTWDVATIAVQKEYRGAALGGLVSMGLYQTLTRAALLSGIDWFIAILDMPVFRMIRWKLCMIFAGFAEVAPLPYLGSVASLPAWCDVVDAERRLAERDAALHEVLVRGRGLEAAMLLADLSAAERFAPQPRRYAAETGVSA